jgi:hypothetical protein
MDKVKINYKELRIGDMVLCGSYAPTGAIIRAVTGGWRRTFDLTIPVHTGIIVDADGQKLIAEMLGKGLSINSLEQYNKGGAHRFIVDIKRSVIYNNEKNRMRLNAAVFNDVRHTLDYDFKGLLEFVFKRVKGSKGRFYCSEYLVHQTKEDGVPYPTRFDTKVSPLDLDKMLNWKSINWKL